jgi:hypothetical protein
VNWFTGTRIFAAFVLEGGREPRARDDAGLGKGPRGWRRGRRARGEVFDLGSPLGSRRCRRCQGDRPVFVRSRGRAWPKRGSRRRRHRSQDSIAAAGTGRRSSANQHILDGDRRLEGAAQVLGGLFALRKSAGITYLPFNEFDDCHQYA